MTVTAPWLVTTAVRELAAVQLLVVMVVVVRTMMGIEAAVLSAMVMQEREQGRTVIGMVTLRSPKDVLHEVRRVFLGLFVCSTVFHRS